MTEFVISEEMREIFRETIFEGHVKTGASRAHAHEVADLTVKAVEEAMQTFYRHISMASEPIITNCAEFTGMHMMLQLCVARHSDMTRIIEAAGLSASFHMGVTQ